MEIRFVEPAEVEQLRRNVQTAFPSKTPQALLDNMPGELVRPEEGRYLGCFDDDGTMIGSLLMMDFEMNVRGKMMKMGAPAYVSTNFLHKQEISSGFRWGYLHRQARQLEHCIHLIRLFIAKWDMDIVRNR